MQELRNQDFREDYIRDELVRLLGTQAGQPEIEFIDHGLMNYVYRAKNPIGVFYFKQALKEPKYKGSMGPALASVPPERIMVEKSFIGQTARFMPPEIVLQTVLNYDSENNILVLTDICGPDGRLLEDILREGNFNPQTAFQIGQFMGILHRETYNSASPVRGDPKNDIDNWKLFLDMRTKGISPDKLGKAAVESLATMYDDGITHTQNMLIYMDCCPKNTLQRSKGIGLVDFELASAVGDPAYDIGFALGHHFIFALIKDMPPSAVKSIEEIEDAYKSELGVQSADFTSRMVRYAGAVVLYRCAGASPAMYIPDSKVPKLIQKGSALLVERDVGLREAFADTYKII